MNGNEAAYTEIQLKAVQRINRCRATKYHQILDINVTATETDIKKAYKRQALLVHPDKNPAPGASDAFKAVEKATRYLVSQIKQPAKDSTRPRYFNGCHNGSDEDDDDESYECNSNASDSCDSISDSSESDSASSSVEGFEFINPFLAFLLRPVSMHCGSDGSESNDEPWQFQDNETESVSDSCSSSSSNGSLLKKAFEKAFNKQQQCKSNSKRKQTQTKRNKKRIAEMKRKRREEAKEKLAKKKKECRKRAAETKQEKKRAAEKKREGRKAAYRDRAKRTAEHKKTAEEEACGRA